MTMKFRFLLVALALIFAPLTHARAQGTWVGGNIARSDIKGGKFYFTYLEPPGYSATGAKVPLFIYEHQDGMGNNRYNGNDNSDYMPNSLNVDGPWNNSTWMNAYGALIVLPYADQTCGDSSKCNFGGYGDTPGSQPNETAVAATAKYMIANFNVDPNRIYIGGSSLGGIGTWAAILDYGIVNGSVDKIFTAGYAQAGVIERGGLTTTDTANVTAGTPIFALSGAYDTTSRVQDWNEPLWTSITGNTSYPAPPGKQAKSTPFWYAEDSALGHDVWDTYNPLPAGKPFFDWLFSQNSGVVKTSTTPQKLPTGYLSVKGNQTIDQNGNNVRLACIGYNEPTGNYTSDAKIISDAGFNCLRYPYYDNNISYTTMDAIVSAASANNLRVIWDHHANEGGGFCSSQQSNGLWYDKNSAAPHNTTDGTDGCGTTGTITYETMRASMIAIASRYANNTTVIGYDLYNEPIAYGGAHATIETNWNGNGRDNASYTAGNGSDILAFYNDLSAAVETAAPGVLIICQGIITGTTSGLLSDNTVQAQHVTDLSMVATKPVTGAPGKVIYSVHDYPSSISGASTDSGTAYDSGRNLGYGYLVTQNIAPVWIGEIGGSLDGVGPDSVGTVNGTTALQDEQTWAGQAVAYFNGKSTVTGAPSFSGSQQAMGTDWWNFGNLGQQEPNGILNADNTVKSGQYYYWKQLLYYALLGEQLSVTSPGWDVPAGASFRVSGVISGTTSAPTLQYRDGAGAWNAMPGGSTISGTAFSFTHPAITTLASAQTISIRDANNTSIVGTSPAFIVAGPESPSGSIITSVGPTVTNGSGEVYSISAGAKVAVFGIEQGGTSNVIELAYVSHTLWQLNSSGNWYSQTRSDASYAGPTTTSPLVGVVEALLIATPVNQVAGKPFIVTGNITGASTTPTLQYEDGAGAWQALPAGATVNTTTFSFPHPAYAASAASTTISVRDANSTGTTAKTNTFAVAAAPVETFTINTIPAQVALTGFTVSGAISNDANPPTLQYEDGSGAWQGLPAGASVTNTSFTFPHAALAQTSGTTISVRNAGIPANFATSNSFIVNAAPPEVLTVATISIQTTGTPFTVSGTIANDQAIPTLQYADNSGAWQPMPSGATVTLGTFTFAHPSMAAGAVNTVAVRDAANTGITGTSPSFVVNLAESANNSTVVTVGPVLVDATGEQFALNAAGQVTVNGSPDTSTSNVKALAYVSHTVWQENTANTWYSKTISTGSWSPPTGTTTSPLPPESLAVNAIASQTSGTAFNVSGTISSSLVVPSLQYQVSGGSWVALPTGSQVTISSYSFVVPTVAASASATIAIRDANTTTITATSNAFVVSAAPVETLSMLAIPPQTSSTPFTVSGTIANAATAPTLQYQVNAGTWLSMPVGANVTATAFSFPEPGIATGGNATVSVRDAGTTTILATSNSFLVTVPTPEALTMATVGTQIASTAFTVSGTIANVTVAPTLQYRVNAGTWLAMPTGASITAGAFSFTVPGQTAGATTISVQDASLTTITATSNSFMVGAVVTENLTIALIANQQAGTAFSVSGTIANAAAAPTLQYQVNAGTWTALPNGSTVSATAFAFIVPAQAAGAVTIGVRDATTTTITAVSNSFTVIAAPVEALVVAPISNQLAGTGFYVTGTIANVTTAPTLQYQINAGAWNGLPPGSATTSTTFRFFLPGQVAGASDTVSVRDATTTTITATSNTFPINPAGTELLTMAAIAPQHVGAAFIVTGTIANATGVPTLQYTDNGSLFQPLPAGSAVTSTSYTFTHPALPASQGLTVTVRDTFSPAITATAPAFLIIAQESSNLATVSTPGPLIVDSAGTAYGLTASGQITINGTTDQSTAGVIEIAYVNRQVWYENTALQWWSRQIAGSWGPAGGTVLGPLPSSRVIIYLTNTARLAVVDGFSLAVPGIVVNDTVGSGAFNMAIQATDGTATAAGSTGSGTSSLAASGSLSTINNILAGLLFNGTAIGAGGVTVSVTDPAKVTSIIHVPIAVVRGASTTQPGRPN